MTLGQRPRFSGKKSTTGAEKRDSSALSLIRAYSARLPRNIPPGALPQAKMNQHRWR